MIGEMTRHLGRTRAARLMAVALVLLPGTHMALALDEARLDSRVTLSPDTETVAGVASALVDADDPSSDAVWTSDRIFGVVPNFSTVEGTTPAQVPPLRARDALRMTARSSFDPYVFAFVGLVTTLGHRGTGGLGRQYASAFADNATGNFMTSAIFPTLLGQDPRYFELGHGSVWRRAGYALGRSVRTRTREGRTAFNYSEIGGNVVAAALSNVYCPVADRSVMATMSRWGMQVMWDALSNELKEFWPDLRDRVHRR